MMTGISTFLPFGVVLGLCVLVVLSLPTTDGKKCGIKLPQAMNINKFNRRVATSEDWVALFIYLCPNDTTLASMRQFRTNISVTNGTLIRVINFRLSHGQPCIGAFTQTFEQVGSRKAVFRMTGPDGLIREDRYLDTGGRLDDYYIKFTCRDRAGVKKNKCFSYFVALMVRHDPLRRFPWDIAVDDLTTRFGMKARDLTLYYEGDVCPVI